MVAQSLVNTNSNNLVINASDIDADGDMDLLTITKGNNEVAWYENMGNSFGSAQVLNVTASNVHFNSIAAADMDSDGDMDILVGGSPILYFKNLDGQGNFGGQNYLAFSSNDAITLPMDIDGDGDMDIVASKLDWTGMEIGWYENTIGQGYFSTFKKLLNAVGTGVSSIEVTDVDGDGDLDVFTGSCGVSSGLGLYKNKGQAVFAPIVPLSNEIGYPLSPQSVDIDGDGDLDLLFCSFAGDKVVWAENEDGAGSFGSWRPVATGIKGAFKAKAGDLDGDGDLDVLVTGTRYNQKAGWYRNDGNGNFA